MTSPPTVRRWQVATALLTCVAAALAAILYQLLQFAPFRDLPVVCWDDGGFLSFSDATPELEGQLTPEFRRALSLALDHKGILHANTNNRPLVTWFDRSDDGLVLTLTHMAAMWVLAERGGQTAGLDPTLQWPLVDLPNEDCDLIRQLAFGDPPDQGKLDK